MQRRQFILQSGLTAAAVLPSAAVLAKPLVSESSDSYAWSLLSASAVAGCQASQPCHRGTVRITVDPEFAEAGITAQTKLWFQTETSPAAFELASFARTGASQRLRLVADSEQLLSLECGVGNHPELTQVLTSAAGLGHLGVGQHWLVLHAVDEVPAHPEASAVMARVRLDVVAV